MTRIERIAGAAAVAGIAGAALGWAFDLAVFPSAWLAAVAAFSGWPLGSLALLFAHALTGGRWGDAIRPALLVGIATTPLLLVAIVPVALLLPDLYPWAHAGAHPPNGFYLNPTFFAARGVFYLAVWCALAAGALVWRDRPHALATLAPVALILLAFTATFAAVDLMESLDPVFNSSAWGMLAANTMVLEALAVAILATPAALRPGTRADLGKLLLALAVLGTYLDFVQVLIVWESNLADDAPWYARHLDGGWGWLFAITAAAKILAPFALLIVPRMQRSRLAVAGVAGMLVAVEVLRSWWVVLPQVGRALSWLDVACITAIGGAAAALALLTRRHAMSEADAHA